jgi:hypothetical protein
MTDDQNSVPTASYVGEDDWPDDPFAVFHEWASETDSEGYRDL